MLVTALYVIWQISLSGAILSASSMEASDRLSSLAQKTVGFGMGLFVFRILYTRLRWYITIPIAISAGFLAMWIEDATVDYFAEETSDKARMDAKKIQIFSWAMLEDKVILSDLESGIRENRIKLKAFAKILGLAIWNSPKLVAQLDASLGPIFNALYGKEAHQNIDAGYARYVEAFKNSQARLGQIQSVLSKINYAQYARDLNRQLGAYAACVSDECRAKIAQRVNGYLEKTLPELDLKLDLEAFCHMERQSGRYVLGRISGVREEKICSTDEKNLHAFIQKNFAQKLKESVNLDEIPSHLRDKILSRELISLSSWREMWKKEINAGIEKRKLEEFADPERYGPAGALAKEGKAYAVSIFLPPVALGFSVTVCFLHLASLGAALTHKPTTCAIIAFICWLAPAVFATPVPISGLGGIYGRWLVFWEGWLYPLGLLRWLMP